MPNYSLTLNINDRDLQNIRLAQLNIILAKPVGGANPNVAWQSFDPLGSNNVSWSEQYGLYASTTAISNGATITKMSSKTPAQDGAYYSFNSGGVFGDPQTGAGAPPAGSYQVNNDMPTTAYPYLTFGLTQTANVNGTVVASNPLNAAVVLANLKAVFTPFTTLWIWLQANLASQTVVTQVTSRTTVATFGGAINSLTFQFDATLGMFVPTSPATGEVMLDDPNVKRLMPAVY